MAATAAAELPPQIRDDPAALRRLIREGGYAGRTGALAPGGRIFLHEMLLAEDGSGPATTASFSMLMLLGTHGRQYSFNELRQILTNAGFVDVDARPTYGYYSVVIGRKA